MMAKVNAKVINRSNDDIQSYWLDESRFNDRRKDRSRAEREREREIEPG